MSPHYRKETMPKKISDRQRIITYASQVSEPELLEAIETLQAIRAGRFPHKQEKSAKGRKKRAPEPVQPALTAAAAPVEEHTDAAPKRGRNNQDKFTPDPAVMRMIKESESGEANA
jgi:hypothetical protein